MSTLTFASGEPANASPGSHDRGLPSAPPSKRYGVIYADPPWPFATYSRKGKGRSADAHDDRMSVEKIKALPVADWAADDAVLLLWVTNPLLPRAFEVIRAWGFALDTNSEGFSTDMGFWTRANVRLCLLATRGRPKWRTADVHQLVVLPPRAHTRNTYEVHERIERLVDGPYLELFVRASRPGWDTWDPQAGLFDGGSAAMRRGASDSDPDAPE